MTVPLEIAEYCLDPEQRCQRRRTKLLQVRPVPSFDRLTDNAASEPAI